MFALFSNHPISSHPAPTSVPVLIRDLRTDLGADNIDGNQ